MTGCAHRGPHDPIFSNARTRFGALRRAPPGASGMCEGVLLHVTYTERGERKKMISARRATKDEEDDYYRKNAL